MATLNQPAFVIPADDKHIRKEDGKPLNATGETVIFTAYWARRLKDGDITVQDKAPKPTRNAGKKPASTDK